MVNLIPYLKKNGYTNNSKPTSYRNKSINIKNMTSNEFKKLLNLYISNEKGLITYNNASASENVSIVT